MAHRLKRLNNSTASEQSQLLCWRYLLVLGSNIAPQETYLQQALLNLEQQTSCRYLYQGPVLQTVALELTQEILAAPLLGYKTYYQGAQTPYLNQLLEIQCHLMPLALYQCIRQIEDNLGHDRELKWAPRAIDIDILGWARHVPEQSFRHCPVLAFYGHWEENHNGSWGLLQIPHRDLYKRDFWQQLLAIKEL